jgi:flagellar basal-body rod protein FlgB
MRLFGPVVDGLRSALDLYAARHRVLTENIANAETPGYRARDLDFQSALRRAFTPPDAGAETGTVIGGGRSDTESAAQVVVDRDAAIKVDGNSVDLDTQMARMSENAFRLTALARMLARQYDGLKSAIEGGRR